MSGDYSKWSYQSWRNYSAVLLQQGRVLTDADWNEWVALMLRRLQAGTLDSLGRAVVPSETADAFRVGVTAGKLNIGLGRAYVDGLLAENHGQPRGEWYSPLAELRGADPLVYSNPPHLLAPAELPSSGRHVVYLRVWQRELTHVVQPELVEKALGVDTTTRLETIWQVKLADAEGASVDCFTPLEDLASFRQTEPAAAGRLWTKTHEVAFEPDPCLVPPSGGYGGIENQLYRVEIHRGGTSGGASGATFKWSRDNGTVATRVTEVTPSLDRLTVESLGRDSVLSLRDGDWIEITDDARELAGQPGEMRRIKAGGGVDEASRTILLETALPAGEFPPASLSQRNTRVRRWDQAGTVLDADGNELADLSAAGAEGTIAVPPTGTWVVLENGIIVRFGLNPASGRFRTGDHWLFAARTADASVEELVEAPPLGIHAQYAPLAILDAPSTLTDCRVVFPPLGGLDSLEYVAGDGQEVTPDPTSTALVPLPIDPTVGVARGPIPVAGRRVRFSLLKASGENVGQIDGGAGPVEVATGPDGLAAVPWALHPKNPSQRLQAELLGADGSPLGLPVRFSARLRTAALVAYDPAKCSELSGRTTVQEAIDALCGRSADEDRGVKITQVVLRAMRELLNDQPVPLDGLSEGIAIEFDQPVDPQAVAGKPICFVTIEMPYPLTHHDQEFWDWHGLPAVGYQPLVLAAETFAEGQALIWQASRETLEWLMRLLNMIEEMEKGDRLLARLTLQGNFVWSEGDPELFVDGDTFGRPQGGWTDLVGREEGLFPGNGRRGGDFRMWFWLVREVRSFRLRLREEIEGGRFAVATIVLSEPAPEDGLTIRLRTDQANALRLPDEVTIEPGATEVRFRVSALESTAGERTAATITLESRVASLSREVLITRPPP
jgi:hypothetical protein